MTMTGDDVPEEWCLVWSGALHKGTASLFDETSETLRAPAFLASNQAEALWYAETLRAEEGAKRRVVTYEPERPLRLLRLAETRAEVEVQLRALGIPRATPREMTVALGRAGWDGLALDGKDSGWHLVVSDPGLLRHLETRDLDIGDPGPEQVETSGPGR